jgi:hypothetical protein
VVVAIKNLWEKRLIGGLFSLATIKGIVIKYNNENWVSGHASIEGNESADQFAKDAAVPENEEELPFEEDRCTSLSHLRRCTTDAKWKRSDEWFVHKCRSRKYYRLNDHYKPNRVIAKTEKSTAQIYYQIKTGHALIGPYLKRIKKSDNDTCRWCNRGVVQSREHLSNTVSIGG